MTNRITLAETPPEGVDNVRWFQLLESLRALNIGVNNNTNELTAVEQGAQAIRPPALIAYPQGDIFLQMSASNYYGQFQAGPIAGLVTTFNVTDWPATFGVNSDLGSSPYPHRGYGFSYLAGAGAGNANFFSAGLLATIPDGFTGWKTNGVEINYSLGLGGLDPAATATVTMQVVRADNGSLIQVVENFTESGGIILRSYDKDDPLRVTGAQLQNAGFRPGDVLRMFLVFNGPNTHSPVSNAFIGRIDLNWE